jgi:hypothetical protein
LDDFDSQFDRFTKGIKSKKASKKETKDAAPKKPSTNMV